MTIIFMQYLHVKELDVGECFRVRPDMFCGKTRYTEENCWMVTDLEKDGEVYCVNLYDGRLERFGSSCELERLGDVRIDVNW